MEALSEGYSYGMQLFKAPEESSSIGINAPAEWVWLAIVDHERRPQWDLGVKGVYAEYEDGTGRILLRRFVGMGTFLERTTELTPPGDAAPGVMQTELKKGPRLLKVYRSRFVVVPQGRFCRVDGSVFADVKPFVIRRYYGAVLAAWLSRSLARLKEYCEKSFGRGA